LSGDFAALRHRPGLAQSDEANTTDLIRGSAIAHVRLRHIASRWTLGPSRGAANVQHLVLLRLAAEPDDSREQEASVPGAPRNAWAAMRPENRHHDNQIIKLVITAGWRSHLVDAVRPAVPALTTGDVSVGS
jgi:hypothetical protein